MQSAAALSLGAYERTGRGMLYRATAIRQHEKAKEHLSAQSKKAACYSSLISGKVVYAGATDRLWSADSSRNSVSWSF
jgi:hypothetical protein